MKGLFISFEGPEGAGKSLQAGLLADRLQDMGVETLLTREPGGTPVGNAIRALLLDPAFTDMSHLTELLLYAAGRAQHVHCLIEPALAAGKLVLCDRFADSTTAYQGYGRGLDLPLIGRLNSLATGGIRPDVTLLLDLDPALGLSRVKQRRLGGGAEMDRMEAEKIAFHSRVRRGFLCLAAAEPERFSVIDAAAPAPVVAEAVFKRVSDLLSRRGWPA